MSRQRRRGSARAGQAVVVLMAALTAASCKPLDDALAVAFGRHMRNQASFDPYENPRPPAVGSVPFAAGNYPTGPYAVSLGQAQPTEYDLPGFTQADLDGVAAPLVNPIPRTAESVARGEVMYDRFCAVCHGPAGNVMEAPILDKLPMMPAFNLAAGGALFRTDGYIYGVIRVGRGIMPQYGHQIPHYDRWHLVNYIRSIQPQTAPAGGN